MASRTTSYMTSLFVLLLSFIAMSEAKYDPQKGYDFVLASAIAYCGQERMLKRDWHDSTRLTEKAGMSVLNAFDNSDERDPITMAILKRDSEKEIIVSFSGTVNPVELLDEILKVGPVPYELHPVQDNSKVVEYFYSHYVTDFRELLHQNIKNYTQVYKDYDLVFTGHSLGGALTVQAAIDILLSGLSKDRKVYLYDYGQPRVANKEFYDSFEHLLDGFFRVVHWRDLVAHVPPWVPSVSGGCATEGILPFYPHHHPEEIFYDEPCKIYKECDMTGEDESCSNSQIHLSIDNHNHYFNLPINLLSNTDDHMDEMLISI